MNDDNKIDFDAWIVERAPALNEPNATPRDEMWAAIQAAQRTSRDAQAGVVPGVTPLRRHWRAVSAIAAALLLGVAIDRLATRRATQQQVATTPAAAAKDSASPSRLYRMAAAQTLTQAEALLVAYRSSDVPSHNPEATRQLGSWGREVLSSTRLLLDSPAGNDPQLRPLLNDLEMVLVQIVALSGAPLDASERALVDRAMQDRNLLPRIRTAMPATMPASAASD
jgi:hypothetical protein